MRQVARCVVTIAALVMGGVALPQPGSQPPPVQQPSWWAVHVASLQAGALVTKLATAAVILVLAAIVYALAMQAVARTVRRVEALSASASPAMKRRSQRAITMLSLLQSVVRWIIGLTLILWLLAAVGVNLVPVLTGAGILGLAVAFGAQALVKDIITGFFILLEGQYAVGDTVKIGDCFGTVRAVGLRTTVVEAVDGRVQHIPNGTIATVTALERPMARYWIDVPLAAGDDVERATEALTGFAGDLRTTFGAYLAEVSVAEARQTTAGLGLVRLSVGVLSSQEWLVNEEIPARIKSLLQKLEIPMPEGRNAKAYAELGGARGGGEQDG